MTGDEAAAVNRIFDAIEELSTLTDKARLVSEFDEQLEDTLSPVNVTETVTTIVDDFRATYPDATIDGTVPDDIMVALPDSRRFDTAITNTIENALEHTEGAEPQVAGVVTEDSMIVQIQVKDDGPGIPDIEQEVLEEGKETPLHHGNGIGLWLIHWCVRTLDGEVTFAERDIGGSCVTLEFPVASDALVSDPSVGERC